MDFGHQSNVRGWEGAKLLYPVVLTVMSPLPALGGSDLCKRPLIVAACPQLSQQCCLGSRGALQPPPVLPSPDRGACLVLGFLCPPAAGLSLACKPRDFLLQVICVRLSQSLSFSLSFNLNPDLRLKTPFFLSSPSWLTWWICTTNAMSSVDWWRCRKEKTTQRHVEPLLITAVRKWWPLCAAVDRVTQLLPLPLCAHNTAGTAKSFGRGAQLPPGRFIRGRVANRPCARTLHVENTSSGRWEQKTHPCLTKGRGAAPGAPAWPSGPRPGRVPRPALHMHAPHRHLQMQWEETRSDESLGTGKAYDKHKN